MVSSRQPWRIHLGTVLLMAAAAAGMFYLNVTHNDEKVAGWPLEILGETGGRYGWLPWSIAANVLSALAVVALTFALSEFLLFRGRLSTLRLSLRFSLRTLLCGVLFIGAAMTFYFHSDAWVFRGPVQSDPQRKSLYFSADSRRVVGFGDNGIVNVWSFETREKVSSWTLPSGNGWALVPDNVVQTLLGPRLLIPASASDLPHAEPNRDGGLPELTRGLDLVDLETGTPVHRFADLTLAYCRISPDGRYLIERRSPDELRLWSSLTGRPLESLKTKADLNDVACVGDRVTVFEDRKLLDFRNGGVLLDFSNRVEYVSRAYLCADGERFLITFSRASEPGLSTELWSVSEKRLIAQVPDFGELRSSGKIGFFMDRSIRSLQTGSVLCHVDGDYCIMEPRIELFPGDTRLLHDNIVFDLASGAHIAFLDSRSFLKRLEKGLGHFPDAGNPFGAPVAPSPPIATVISPSSERILLDYWDYVELFERRRPEYWWGVAWLPEFWLAAFLGFALIWSLVRDAKDLRPALDFPRIPA